MAVVSNSSAPTFGSFHLLAVEERWGFPPRSAGGVDENRSVCAVGVPQGRVNRTGGSSSTCPALFLPFHSPASFRRSSAPPEMIRVISINSSTAISSTLVQPMSLAPWSSPPSRRLPISLVPPRPTLQRDSTAPRPSEHQRGDDHHRPLAVVSPVLRRLRPSATTASVGIDHCCTHVLSASSAARLRAHFDPRHQRRLGDAVVWRTDTANAGLRNRQTRIERGEPEEEALGDHRR
jgi:hypothetical protein